MPTHRDQSRNHPSSSGRHSEREEKRSPSETMPQSDNEALYSSPVQKHLLLQWTAPIRPFRRLNKDVFSTLLAGAFLLGVIIFFIDGAIPVIALASLLFLFYILGTVPPAQIIHTITTWGIESDGRIYPWQAMARYWIQGEKGHRMLVIDRGSGWMSYLRFMLSDELDEQALHDLLQQYLVEDQPKPGLFDKAANWLESKIRLAPDG